MNACGKSYSMDKCIDEVTTAVKMNPPRGSFRSIRVLLSKKREKKSGELGILP